MNFSGLNFTIDLGEWKGRVRFDKHDGRVECPETYSFSSVMAEAWSEQTLIHCTGPKTNGGERVPKGCTLRERAIAYPNHEGRYSTAVACAAGHPIVFHPSGTLAECTLDADQPVATSFIRPVSLGTCQGSVRFDKDGRPNC